MMRVSQQLHDITTFESPQNHYRIESIALYSRLFLSLDGSRFFLLAIARSCASLMIRSLTFGDKEFHRAFRFNGAISLSSSSE